MERIDLNSSDLADAQVEIVDKPESETLPPCSFITGIAGSGKTYLVKQRVTDDPKWGLICSTTGVSAVNLGTITLNSALGFFDTASLEDKFMSGFLRTRVHQLAKQYQNLVIDEVSMLDARQLDMIHQAMKQANEFKDVKTAMGIVCVGDFMQLPPVNAPWAFEAECWPRFDVNTERLTKCWRQGEGPFLDALNLMRKGNGAEAVAALETITTFRRESISNFDGTTIVATNQLADDHNWLRYRNLKGESHTYKSSRWGKEGGGWKIIPENLPLKLGTLVMVLVNDSPAFTYVNGDLGHVEQMESGAVWVKLKRNDAVVQIPFLDRPTEQRSAPEEFSDDEIEQAETHGTKLSDGSFYDAKKRRWVRGSIHYMPLRYGWASTCFKSQGLSLDSVQVDMRHTFMSTPGMVYVACSRSRTAQGLTLVGSKDIFVRRCKTEPKVMRWL